MTRMVLTLSPQKTATYSDLTKQLHYIYRLKDELSRLNQREDISYPMLAVALGKVCRIKDKFMLLSDKYDGCIACEAEVKDDLIVLEEEVSKICVYYIAPIFS